MERAEHNLGRWVGVIAAPLIDAVHSDDPVRAVRDLLAGFGWDLTSIADLTAVAEPLSELARSALALDDALAEEPADVLDVAAAVAAVGAATGRVAAVVSAWRPPSIAPDEAAALAGELARDVIAGLADLALRTRAPRLRAVLLALGVIGLDPVGEVRLGPNVVRRPGVRLGVRVDRLGRWLTDPGTALHDLVAAAATRNLPWPDLVAVAWDLLGPQLVGSLIGAGFPAVWRPGDALSPPSMWIFTGEELLGAGSATPPAWIAIAVEADGGTVLAHVVPRGTWQAAHEGAAWKARFALDAGGAFTVSGAAVTADADITIAAEVASVASPVVRLGPDDGLHIDLGRLTLGLSATLTDGAPPDLGVSVGLHGIQVAFGPGGSDSFVARLLGQALAAPVDVAADWTRGGGLRVTGGLDRLSVVLAEQLALGPVTVRRLTLTAEPADGAFAVGLVSNVVARLGPLTATVEGVGLTLRLDDGTGSLGPVSARAGLRPPKGIGLSLDAAAVSGGGYLFLDPDKGEYAGVLELSVKVVSLKAIGLLNTRLPDGRPGFSLLLIITAEFPPIPLGFGFTLLGVGGLLGVNRTVALEPLREGVRTGALDAVLFPKDPVGNATRLLPALRTLFPPAEARHAFGPMVRLGWGPKQLLEMELALVLELPSPLRLIVAGRMRLRLPDEKAPVVLLRLDVVGILDLDRGEASIDASLVDSRIAAFTICGDMAMRVGWTGGTRFALAVGGFHPRFTPPPGFPALKRLSISLGEGDNPRIRLEAYLAITSNTIQFGARLDLHVEAGPFSAAAHAGLDALVRFSPFHFVVALSMGIDVSWGGTPLLHAQLEANLEGPAPWHAYGHLEFGILFLKGRIDVDITVGEAVSAQAPRVDLETVLRSALEADDAWTTDSPPSATTGVSLRGGPAGGLVMSPFGRFTVRQRALPLSTTITRYGAAVPEPGTATRFEVRAVTVGGTRQVDPPAVFDGFAAAQYAELSDDERLSRPAFEQMPSGVTATVSAHRWPQDAAGTPIARTADIVYDEAVIDDVDAPTPDPVGRRLDPALAGLLVASGAAAGSASRRAQAVRGPDQRVEVVEERYVVVPVGALPDTPPAAPTSYAQAAERRGEGQLVTAGEVTR
ncbi:DUF6603 domain-containing protein [Thermopolyspora sp. NPDC052614]|uniref:DUF6603 domain-containing protein n=1 Tax=Thermopolyspora sp. NPDC052614 TaxID=3155682 RepID=UPI0034447766